MSYEKIIKIIGSKFTLKAKAVPITLLKIIEITNYTKTNVRLLKLIIMQ